ncbi:MAG TPA: GPW/gp25 family protein [Myxococcales bacterium]|nr:GPW/gp25 family protein [Myxococcales bacterium]
MRVDFPWQIDRSGRTGVTDEDDHVRDLIEQVLFTTPGERVNRPTFGSGLLRLVFGPNSPEQGATAQLLVQAALQEWLGDVIVVEGTSIDTSVESVIQVTVRYMVRRDERRATSTFSRRV